MSSTSPIIDTLPPAERDEQLEYSGFGGCASICRFRLYTDRDGAPEASSSARRRGGAPDRSPWRFPLF